MTHAPRKFGRDATEERESPSHRHESLRPGDSPSNGGKAVREPETPAQDHRAQLPVLLHGPDAHEAVERRGHEALLPTFSPRDGQVLWGHHPRRGKGRPYRFIRAQLALGSDQVAGGGGRCSSLGRTHAMSAKSDCSPPHVAFSGWALRRRNRVTGSREGRQPATRVVARRRFATSSEPELGRRLFGQRTPGDKRPWRSRPPPPTHGSAGPRHETSLTRTLSACARTVCIFRGGVTVHTMRIPPLSALTSLPAQKAR